MKKESRIAELFEKYHIISDGFKRNYVIDVNERRVDMDFVTPIELNIFVNRSWDSSDEENNESNSNLVIHKFKTRVWIKLLQDVVSYLQSKKPINKEELYSFRTDWSKGKIFAKAKAIDNMVKIEDDLYLSVNYTGVHSEWILGDILKLYGITAGDFIVNRPAKVEPEEVRNFFIDLRKEEFKEFLMSEYKKDENSANTIIKVIDFLNKILNKMNTSYNDFFLFDCMANFCNYASQVGKRMKDYVNRNEAKIEKAIRYLSLLGSFYSKLEREAKKRK